MTPPPIPAGTPLLRIDSLAVRFPVRSGFLQRTTSHIRAVEGVSFDIAPGEALGLVGESGSGKTTVGRAVMRLVPEHHDGPVVSGRVLFEGKDVLAMGPRDLRAWRRKAQIIFQDPGGSFNPRRRVRDILAEPLVVHRLADRSEIARRLAVMMDRCGLPRSGLDRFPHEFSGGQKQRLAIARVLLLEPALIVCDEPTSALDVSIQAQILNLLGDLRSERGLSYLFISHDMAVVNHVCERVVVMREGRIVESGPCDRVLSEPSDPYTRDLVNSIPGRSLRGVRTSEIAGTAL
ncbi:MAG: ABC transporter ATP-binding protein [Phycisphaeraceae bacterium]|nr:ABC transporter ATP-binding protein [Phycisphaeraceae bacterium]HRJ49698.1 ATP-binding cassette domain-containing protein [Phycisphaerales bacterium]